MDIAPALQQQLEVLRAERDAALAREAALAEVLKAINRSVGDPVPVFEMVLEKACSLCAAAAGSLLSFDGEYVRALATHGFDEEAARLVAQPRLSGGLHKLLLQGERYIHRSDAQAPAISPVDELTRTFITQANVRTALWVPLRRDGKLLGIVHVHRHEVRPFSEAEVSLLESFADQAVIALDNARLVCELRQRGTDLQEALDQQTAMAEVLGVINANSGDPVPVFEAILERAHRLCDTTTGSLATFDGKYFRALATHGFSEEYAPRIRQPFLPHRILQPLVEGARFVRDPDVRVTEADDIVLRSSVESGGGGTAMGVPLRKDGRLIGYISAFRPKMRPFSDKEIALLEGFAAQAVIAMENARLITEQREALEQQTATAEVLGIINANPGHLAPVFDSMLEKAMRLCVAAFGHLMTFDGKGFTSVAARGVPPAFAEFAHSVVSLDSEHPNSALAQVARGADMIHQPDITDDDVYRSGIGSRRALADLGGARTRLMVALRKDGILLGVINIYRQEERPFSPKQVALLESFAAQAVIAMENARLITEQREALEQQTATVEVLGIINANPGNLAPVFDAMLEKAMRLCDAQFGTLLAYDGANFLNATTRGLRPELVTFFQNLPIKPVPGMTFHRLVQGEDVAQATDLADDDVYRSGNPARRALVDIGGARTQLLVALRKDGRLLGAINVFRQEAGRPFSEKQIALLRSFAAQAVIAMENARLLTEQSEALERQTATAEVLQAINTSPGNLSPVFEAILERTMRLCNAAFGLLYTYDGKTFHTAALRGVPQAFAEFRWNNPPQPKPGSPLARMLETRRYVHSLDLMADPGYLAGDARGRSLADLGGARTWLAVPLVKDEAVLGFVTIYRQEVRAFSAKQINLLESFAAQAVIAMENARLLHELRSRTEELALRQAELRITFENMGDGVALYDETLHLVAWNRKFQEIFDVPDSLLGQRGTFEEHTRYLAARGDYGPDVDAEEQVHRLTARAFECHVYERVRPDGRVVEIRHNPVADGGFVLIFSDITERKRSEAEIRVARDAAETAYRELKATQANLIQAEKMASLGQLTAGIAHEIKNPLNFVNNFSLLSVELLDELKQAAAPVLTALDGDRRAGLDEILQMLTGNLQKINEHGRRADGIVRSMLEHSRGGSGDRRSVDLNALVEEALNLAYHGARAQDQSFNITLQRDYADNIAPITLVPQDITRGVLNLVSNGFYAARKRQQSTDPGFQPTLRVATRELGDAVEICVRDNGIGIQADIRDKLFQPFFTTKAPGEGTGLGLSISYDIVSQQHGGSITVDSRVGEFSAFTVRLPRR